MEIIINDYDYNPKKRESFRNSKIKNIISESVRNNQLLHKTTINNLMNHRDVFREITIDPVDDIKPFWRNGFIPPIDGAMIYSMVSHLKPRYYVEIGSGNTTKFANHAIRNYSLDTKIISIDPYPRSDIDKLCYKIYRMPLENMELEFFDSLHSNDIFIIDNSHRCLPNSDVTVFFTEIIHKLPKGILYAIHDIALPDETYVERLYTEQYLLALYLLCGANGDTIFFPTGYLSNYTDWLKNISKKLDVENISFFNPDGFFWMQKG